MKFHSQMDLEEWEILPDDEGSLEIHDDGAHNLKPQDHKDPAKISDHDEIKNIKSLDDDDTSDQNQSVDMKVESPKSSGIVLTKIEAFQFEETVNGPREEDEADTEMVNNMNKNHGIESNEKDDDRGGINIWKRSLTGIGAICSFGLAAAAICSIICSSHKKSQKLQQNQKLKFQIYDSHKRIKQVVHYASKINEAITGLSRASVTVGGYYDHASA